MRIPVPIVLALCLMVIGASWWYWSRQPDDVELGEKQPSKTRVVDTRTLRISALAGHSETARRSPGELVKVASELEARGDFHSALMAYERMVDSTDIEGEELRVATAGLRRLREIVPPWNRQPEKALSIAVNARIGGDGSGVESMLQALVDRINAASGGILRAELRVKHAAERPIPGGSNLAIWFGGDGSEAPISPVTSRVLVANGDLNGDWETEISRMLYQRIAAELAEPAELRVPDWVQGGEPSELYETRITRLGWETLGRKFATPPP
ncbi:MAG: hypothetical protein ACO3RV_01455 [Luteolibacter sp.]